MVLPEWQPKAEPHWRRWGLLQRWQWRQRRRRPGSPASAPASDPLPPFGGLCSALRMIGEIGKRSCELTGGFEEARDCRLVGEQVGVGVGVDTLRGGGGDAQFGDCGNGCGPLVLGSAEEAVEVLRGRLGGSGLGGVGSGLLAGG